MGGVRSPTGSVARLLKGMARVKSPAFRREAHKQLSMEFLDQTQRCFVESRSPYGEPWKPVSRQHNGIAGLPLRDTGRLMNSFTRVFSATGFRVDSRVVYAAIHNYGGVIRRPERQAIRGSNGREIGSSRKLSSRRRFTVTSIRSHTFVMPRRQFIPDTTRGLSAPYRAAFKSIVDELVLSTMGRP